MKWASSWFFRLRSQEYLWLGLLLAATLAVHFCYITQPDQLVFDEQHHVNDARSIISGEGTLHPDHPSLGKLFIAAGILVFGDNPMGWRFFSVIFGTIIIALFYIILRRLNMSPTASWLATFLLALENLSFIQASVAMLDVYMLSFTLLAFWFNVRGS